MAEMEANGDAAELSQANGAAPSAALFIVIGEPFSEDQRELILERITTGQCEISLIRSPSLEPAQAALRKTAQSCRLSESLMICAAEWGITL